MWTGNVYEFPNVEYLCTFLLSWILSGFNTSKINYTCNSSVKLTHRTGKLWKTPAFQNQRQKHHDMRWTHHTTICNHLLPAVSFCNNVLSNWTCQHYHQRGQQLCDHLLLDNCQHQTHDVTHCCCWWWW